MSFSLLWLLFSDVALLPARTSLDQTTTCPSCPPVSPHLAASYKTDQPHGNGAVTTRDTLSPPLRDSNLLLDSCCLFDVAVYQHVATCCTRQTTALWRAVIACSHSVLVPQIACTQRRVECRRLTTQYSPPSLLDYYHRYTTVIVFPSPSTSPSFLPSTPPARPAMSLGASTLAQNPPPYYNKDAGVDEQTGMRYIRLGNTGAVVSRICLGLMSYAELPPGEKPMQEWMLPAEQSLKFVEQALSAGITFFDTAEIYSNGGSERFFGNALRQLLPNSRFTREDLFIGSKIHPNRSMDGGIGGNQKGLSRKSIHSAIEGTLERLQLDYLDLYLIHRYDPNTAPEETMKALHDMVVSGKVRYIGASAMYVWQYNRLNEVAERNGWTKFSVMQNQSAFTHSRTSAPVTRLSSSIDVACCVLQPSDSSLSRPVLLILSDSQLQRDL